jgi:hypothetical protein
MNRQFEPPEHRPAASSAYALGRLWRAIQTATTHPDPDTRERAEQKALAWEAVLDGMASGRLDVGSRTPVADTPAWVTLEVAHGGFATGGYVAEGPLDDGEQTMLGHVPPTVGGSSDRMRLNSWFLTDEGLARLERALNDRTYVVGVPEHGALLVVAWLVAHGHHALALDLVAELYPLIDRLRFYPVLTDRPPASTAVVHRQSVGELTKQLAGIRPPKQVAAMNEALLVWRPLYDRLVELWLETVQDDWPCRQWPSDWAARRSEWLGDYQAAASGHPLCGDHRRARSNFTILRIALEACADGSSTLTGRDVGRIRLVLRRSVARWGEPGSPRLRELRSRQAAWAGRPTRAELATAVVERLAPLPQEGGLGDPATVLRPVELDDRAHAIPRTLVRKVERSREAPIENLVADGIIPSSEVLARVLPQITSHVASAPFADPTLRDLYARIYSAFRQRRSLLLLNLAHQVRIEELPWVKAVEPFRVTSADAKSRARDTLRDTTVLALTSFPQTILPNPLVREMAVLAQQADVHIPFVEEVAADIFMGTFTMKWREAASVAASTMAGSLYARYYDLPDATTWVDTESDRGVVRRVVSRWGKPTAEAFARVCEARAREAASGDGSFVARNGTIIEQAQILTTHNLAPLVDRLGLHDVIGRRALDLAATTFDWAVREQNGRRDSWHAQLQAIKNSAYAWRQAVFFLSFTTDHGRDEALARLRASIADQPPEWQQRFEPAVGGLEAVVEGARFDANGKVNTSRRFLGWSVGHHWLLPERTPAMVAYE